MITMHFYIQIPNLLYNKAVMRIKPRPSLNKYQIMEHYAEKTNWYYRASNPIHCRRAKKFTKIENLLTQSVSAQGSPLPVQKNDLSLNKRKLESHNLNQRMTEQSSKKNKGTERKKDFIQLQALYKRTFKYNTTIHQILKNPRSRFEKQSRVKWGQKNKSISFASDRNQNQKIQKLEKIKKKCQTLDDFILKDQQSNHIINRVNLEDFSTLPLQQQPRHFLIRKKQKDKKLLIHRWLQKSIQDNSLQLNFRDYASENIFNAVDKQKIQISQRQHKSYRIRINPSKQNPENQQFLNNKRLTHRVWQPKFNHLSESSESQHFIKTQRINQRDFEMTGWKTEQKQQIYSAVFI